MRKNRYLSLLIAAGVAHIAFELFQGIDNYQYQIILRIISISAPLLIGPSLLLFFRHALKTRDEKVKEHYHFVPFFLLMAFLISAEIVSSAISEMRGLPTYVPIIEGLKGAHLIIYMVLSYRVIINLRNNNRVVEYKNNAQQILLWFRILMLFIIAAIILSLCYFVALKYFEYLLPVGSPKFIALILVLFIYSVAFMAIKFPLVVLTESDGLVVKRKAKYETSPLQQGDILNSRLKLSNYMSEERPYLNSELKVEGLAKEIDIPPHHLSQIINQGFEKSFQDFINQYRIEEFKKRIIDPKHAHKTILAIALESGFSSKSSFNRIFKLGTGITPLQFKKQNDSNTSHFRK